MDRAHAPVWVMLAIAAFWATPAQATPPLAPAPVMFGVPLAAATRRTLEHALHHAHMRLKPAGHHQRQDVYAVNGALKGAQTLVVDFTDGGRFAKARYEFKSFMDTTIVARVIRMVKAKYGPPATVSGHLGIGPVRALWHLQQGFRVVVTRGWPNVTTFMTIESRSMVARLRQERKHRSATNAAF
ncbi:MAG: hypothetical protein ACYCXG_00885 [Acidiferrobacter sp.]